MKKTDEQKRHDELKVEINLLAAKLNKFFERYEQSRKFHPINGLALPQNEGEE